MAKKFVYHYCSTWAALGSAHKTPLSSQSSTTITNTTGKASGTIDGIAELSGQILDMEDYLKLKDLICAEFDDVDRDSLCITSLTLIGEK